MLGEDKAVRGACRCLKGGERHQEEGTTDLGGRKGAREKNDHPFENWTLKMNTMENEAPLWLSSSQSGGNMTIV